MDLKPVAVNGGLRGRVDQLGDRVRALLAWRPADETVVYTVVKQN